MGQAGLRVVIVSERPRGGAGGARRTTLSLVPRWGEATRVAAKTALPAAARRARRPGAPSPPASAAR